MPRGGAAVPPPGCYSGALCPDSRCHGRGRLQRGPDNNEAPPGSPDLSQAKDVLPQLPPLRGGVTKSSLSGFLNISPINLRGPSDLIPRQGLGMLWKNAVIALPGYILYRDLS